MRKQTGFTIIELLITIALIAILTSITVAVYSKQVLKGRRIDGIDALLSISLAEERYRSTHTAYGDLGAVWSGRNTSLEGFYTVGLSNLSATSYTITVTGINGQENDVEGNVDCRTLSYSVQNGIKTTAPVECWPK